MKVYCIHREQDKERKEALDKELLKVDLDVEFVEPVKAKVDNYLGRINSLKRTTIKLLEKAISKNMEYIAIMEDDCVFDENLMKIFFENSFPENFDFINLSYSGIPNLGLSGREGIYTRNLGSLSCQFYIIHRRVMKRYLYNLRRSKRIVPIDEVTRRMQKRRRNSYIMIPQPVTHEKNKFSTLKNRNVKY